MLRETLTPKIPGLDLRLSVVYFCYFGALGALVPYWSLYLHSLGFPPHEIGELLAIFGITRIISPNIWCYFADYLGTRMPLVRYATGFATISLGMVFGVSDFWGLAVVMTLFSFFANAFLPQIETTVIDHVGTNGYGRIRLWGSVGFIVAVLLSGPLLDRFGIQLLPWLLLFLYSGLWLSSLAVPEATVVNSVPATAVFAQLLVKRKIIIFILICFMMQASHGPYYTFYSIYLESQGNSRALISWLWAWGVICEVWVFFIMGRWIERYGAVKLLRLTLLLATMRWILIGNYAHNLSILIFAQVLHAATFGAYHASAIHIVHNYFAGRHQTRGQAIYGSLGFGAGGMAGSFYAGYLWDWLGPEITFGVGGMISMGALIILWRFNRQVPLDPTGSRGL